jgi:hypothetical protein
MLVDFFSNGRKLFVEERLFSVVAFLETQLVRAFRRTDAALFQLAAFIAKGEIPGAGLILPCALLVSAFGIVTHMDILVDIHIDVKCALTTWLVTVVDYR